MNISRSDLVLTKCVEYAICLGADCAFFVTTDVSDLQPLYATGTGGQLHPFTEKWTALCGKWLVLIKPNVAISTKEAYAGIVPCRPTVNCKEILMQPIEAWRGNLLNDFETSVFS